jgi:protein gp37
MSDRSAIEWTDATWNPIVGCSIVSPGCTNCYAMKMAARIEKMNRTGGSGSSYVNHYDGTTRSVNGNVVWTGKLARASEKTLLEPLGRKKPTKYFVNSMGDLFHEDCPDEWIDRVFAVMALCPQHTFQILTKRAERMRDYLIGPHRSRWASVITKLIVENVIKSDYEAAKATAAIWETVALPTIWLGVSCERQQEADERIPLLLQTPAAVRFISAEPLLGAIDASKFMWPVCGWWRSTHKSYEEAKAAGAECGLERQSLVHADRRFLDWVIVGGESGPDARPFNVTWARSIIDQCHAANVPVFVKQLGRRPYWDCVNGCGKWAEHVRFTRGLIDGSAADALTLKDRKGGDWSEWPDDLRIREFPRSSLLREAAE